MIPSRIVLSIVIPAFEESQKITRDVEDAISFLECQHFDGEIIVVDDGSSDGTYKIAERVPPSPGIPVRVVHFTQHRGKGYAIKTGILRARGEYIMFADSGGCVPFENASLGMVLIRCGVCEIAHGSRRLLESSIKKHHLWYRRFLSVLFRWVMIFWMEIPYELTDTQCGFKVYRGDIAKALFGKCVTDGFMFEVEIILRALRSGYRIREFPIEWTADRDSRLSVIKSWQRTYSELVTIKRVLKNYSE